MKFYFLAIPIIIGVLFGILVSYDQDEFQDSNVLSKKNLLDGASILGDPDAKITIVEFGDYQCTFCYKFHQDTMKKINANYISSGKVNFVYKDFPLNGEASKIAAEASYCAQKQGKFWQYHDIIFDNWNGENTGWVTRNALIEFAKYSELDIEGFNTCMNNSEFKEKVLQNEQFAREINIDATPSFLIFSENDVYRIIGAQSFERFEQVFDELGST